MELSARKVSRVAFAYLWSILFWMGLAFLAAGEDKAHFLERGLQTSYWTALLIESGFLLSAALLTPPHFRDRSPLSDQQTASVWPDSRVCSFDRALHHRLRNPPLDFSAALEYSCSEV